MNTLCTPKTRIGPGLVLEDSLGYLIIGDLVRHEGNGLASSLCIYLKKTPLAFVLAGISPNHEPVKFRKELETHLIKELKTGKLKIIPLNEREQKLRDIRNFVRISQGSCYRGELARAGISPQTKVYADSPIFESI